MKTLGFITVRTITDTIIAINIDSIQSYHPSNTGLRIVLSDEEWHTTHEFSHETFGFAIYHERLRLEMIPKLLGEYLTRYHPDVAVEMAQRHVDEALHYMGLDE